MKRPEVTDYTDFTYYDMPAEARKKLDVGNIFMNQVECAACHWIIRSKNRHDTPTCKCGKTTVDGGSWYQITSGPAIDRSLNYKYLLKEIRDDER